MIDYIYVLLKLFLTIQLVPGFVLVTDPVLGYYEQYMDEGKGKFVRATRVFNDFSTLKLDPIPLKLFIGCCKLLGVLALWTNAVFGMERMATVCFAIMFAMVSVEHYCAEDDFAPPAIFCALALTKAFIQARAKKPMRKVKQKSK